MKGLSTRFRYCPSMRWRLRSAVSFLVGLLAVSGLTNQAGAQSDEVPRIITIAGKADLGDNGPATLADLDTITAVGIDAQGRTLIATADSKIRRIETDGTLRVLATVGFPETPNTERQYINEATAMVPMADGSVLVAAASPAVLYKLWPDSRKELWPQSQGFGHGCTPSVDPFQVCVVADLATDSTGNVFALDSQAATVYKITPSGVVTRVAGTGSAGTTYNTMVNAPATAAQLWLPNSIAVAGNRLWIVDAGQLRYVENGFTSPFAAPAQSTIPFPLPVTNGTLHFASELYGILPDGRLVIDLGGYQVGAYRLGVGVEVLLNGGTNLPRIGGVASTSYLGELTSVVTRGTTLIAATQLRHIYSFEAGSNLSLTAGRRLPDVVPANDFPVALARIHHAGSGPVLLWLGWPIAPEAWVYQGGQFRRRAGGYPLPRYRLWGDDEDALAFGFDATLVKPGCNDTLVVFPLGADSVYVIGTDNRARRTSERFGYGACGGYFYVRDSSLFASDGRVLLTGLPTFFGGDSDARGGFVGSGADGFSATQQWIWYRANGTVSTVTWSGQDDLFRGPVISPNGSMYGLNRDTTRLYRFDPNLGSVSYTQLVPAGNSSSRPDGRINQVPTSIRSMSQTREYITVLDGPYLRVLQTFGRTTVPQAPGGGASGRPAVPQAPGTGTPGRPVVPQAGL
jgi:hypothetical protein